MVFLRGGNRHDVWTRFCAEHQSLLAEIGLPVAVTRSEHKFRDLMESGTAKVGQAEVSLTDLGQEQWNALEKFTTVFFREFESYAPLDLFPAFRRELQRRQSSFHA